MELSPRKPPQPLKPLPEILQWLMRFGLMSIALLYLAIDRTDAETLDYVALFVCLTLLGVAAAFLVRAIARSEAEGGPPIFGVGFDSLAITSGLYFGGELTSALYVAYFLSTFAHGYRHGVNTLLAGTGFNALGFTFVITQQFYWHDHVVLALGLLVALVVLPLYFAWMVDKSVLTRLSPYESGMGASWRTPDTRLIVPLRGMVEVCNQLLSSSLNKEQRSYARTVSATATSLLSIVQASSGTQQSTEQTTQVADFDLLELLRNTAKLLSGAEPMANAARVSYQIGPLVALRLNGDAFALQQVLIDLTNELLDNASHCVDITVDLTDSPPQSERVWLTFDISADYGVEIDRISNAPLTSVKGPGNHTRPHEGEARFVTDVAPELIEKLGGQFLPSMDEDGHTTYRVQVPFALPLADADQVESRTLRQTRTMLIGGDLSGGAQAFQLLLGWGADVTQRNSIALAFADLIHAATRASGYHLVVVDGRGLNTDINAIARAMKQEPTLSAIPLILIAPQRFSADAKADALRAGYATVLETPLDKTLLFNALHATDRAGSQQRDGVVHLIDRYASTHRVLAPLEILVTMNNFAEQTAIKAMLEQSGHRVYTAENGTQALEALDNHHFDLAFMDFYMPDIGGLEALRLYRYSRAETHPLLTPVILLTEDNTELTRNRCIDAGAHNVLTKPIRKHELLAAIGQVSADTSGAALPYQRPAVQRIDKRLSNAAILDQETLSDLELLGSGISFVAELVANFLQDSEHLLKRMVTAQQQAQTHIFRDIAHALKGSAGSVGAKELFKLASEACTLRGKQFEHTSAQLVEDLDSAFQTARVALLAHIDERKSQNSQ